MEVINAIAQLYVTFDNMVSWLYVAVGCADQPFTDCLYEHVDMFKERLDTVVAASLDRPDPKQGDLGDRGQRGDGGQHDARGDLGELRTRWQQVQRNLDDAVRMIGDPPVRDQVFIDITALQAGVYSIAREHGLRGILLGKSPPLDRFVQDVDAQEADHFVDEVNLQPTSSEAAMSQLSTS